ncbi:MAG: sigma-70 family RNA polymerase sigma factor [Gemmataceae bacterium]|nr:sigma-70 family RNA polymerase sigma factor [Gemmataceae bacterium]MCI0741010.1 sigma-70 family RNA polymerase sigma factor [Gemmataceae bacterium]
MSSIPSESSLMLQLLRQAGAGDQAAVNALLRHSGERLTALARRMLGGFARVKRWADTDDVLQNALLRLVNALKDVQPKSHRDFLALATLQIRRELIDLARRFFGPEGLGARHDSQTDGLDCFTGNGVDPGLHLQWRELHQKVDELPEEEREVVGLLFYQGLTQAEVAEILALSVRTVQRRWHAALVNLHRVWVKEA